MNTKLQTIQETLAAGATDASVKLMDITLDEAYSHCVALGIVHTAGTSEQFDIEIRDNDNTYVDMVSKVLLEANASVAPSLKLMDVNFKVTSKKISIYVKPHATTSDDITIQAIFKLVKSSM